MRILLDEIHKHDMKPDKVFQELPEAEEEAVLGESFLDPGLLCEHRWSRWGHDTKICEVPREWETNGGRPTTAFRPLT